MYVGFEFKDGSNPYIATSNKAFWKMLNKYYITQTSENTFEVEGKLELWSATPRKLSSYDRAQAILQSFAIEWQYKFSELNYSWGELAMWQSFFEEYGRKYGLLREFRENAIC